MGDRGNVSVGIMAGCFTSLGLVFLNEIMAVDFLAVYLERQVFQQVGSEFDVALPGAKQLVQAVIGLRDAGMPVIAEIGRQAFADQCPALLDALAQPGGSLLFPP